MSLFSVSISTSKLPIQWRSHHITSIHESDDKSLISTYRPISLYVLSKVLEKVIYNNIITHLENSFTAQQFGFCLEDLQCNNFYFLLEAF